MKDMNGLCFVFKLKLVGAAVIVKHKVIAPDVNKACHRSVKVADLNLVH